MGKPLQDMMMDYSIHKVNFQVRGWEMSKNTAGVNHFRCSAIAEILWSRRRLQEISKIQKIGEGYVIAVTLTPVAGFVYISRWLNVTMFKS